ncbi:MAG: hypothetical protein M3Q65_11530 [Chloroflexota bacterium]|nr:hypothetical protein [Chloroflexota bacterium]
MRGDWRRNPRATWAHAVARARGTALICGLLALLIGGLSPLSVLIALLTGGIVFGLMLGLYRLLGLARREHEHAPAHDRERDRPGGR